MDDYLFHMVGRLPVMDRAVFHFEHMMDLSLTSRNYQIHPLIAARRTAAVSSLSQLPERCDVG